MEKRDLRRAKAYFFDHGVTVTDWAKARGFNRQVVYDVLRGRLRCRRGQAHQVAVALGLKKAELDHKGPVPGSHRVAA